MILFLAFVAECLICFKYVENLTNLADNPHISTYKLIFWLILLGSIGMRIVYLFFRDYIMLTPPKKLQEIN